MKARQVDTGLPNVEDVELLDIRPHMLIVRHRFGDRWQNTPPNPARPPGETFLMASIATASRIINQVGLATGASPRGAGS
jgi:hypothetical protein